RCWKDCWSVQEYYGGFAQRGDSGAQVVTLDRSGKPVVLGQLVAVFGAERSRSRRQAGLVQDIRAVTTFLNGERTVTHPTGHHVEVLSDDLTAMAAILRE